MNSDIQSGRLFVFGGAYGNLEATRALLAKAGSLGFTPAQTLFTGDLVAYCGNPQETVDLIREYGCHVIMGNCEEALAGDAEDCGCGFEEGSACSVLSAQWFAFCRERLDHETKAWMGTLPRALEIEVAGLRFLACHGSPVSINDFIFPSQKEKIALALDQASGFDGVIAGHSGLPFVCHSESGFWLNSGAAGMPANDGTADVWYATLEADHERTVHAATHRLAYDVESAMRSMAQAGLNNGYHDCLASGLWPSLDVLPGEERARTGQAIPETKKAFRRTPLDVSA